MESPDHWTNFHFSNIADKYDKFFEHRRNYEEALATDLIRIGSLSPELDVVDLACGSGWTFRTLDKYGLRFRRSINVDPCGELLAKAKTALPWTECRQMTGEEFSKEDIEYDRLVAFTGIHHLSMETIEQTFKNFRSQLRSGGMMIFVSLASDGKFSYPIFNAALQRMYETGNGLSSYVRILEKCGFREPRMEVTNYEVEMSRDEYEFSVRNRFIFCLNHFSDKEIDEGWKEMNLSDPFVFNAKHYIVVAYK